MSATDWITALTSLGALGAAAWAGVTTVRLYRVETGRDDEARERSVREQASQVSAWCVVWVRDAPDGRPTSTAGIQAHNSSTSPVFDVAVTSRHRDGRDVEPVLMRVLPPGDFLSFEDRQFGWKFPRDAGRFTGELRPVTKHEEWKVTGIDFTDAHGHRWHRDAHGILTSA